jgi:hypothetical protein
LFLGAEFTRVYARASGSRILPNEHAIATREEARAAAAVQTKTASPALAAAPGSR